MTQQIIDYARCPQCQQVLSVSDLAEEAGSLILVCETIRCPTSNRGTLFEAVERQEVLGEDDYTIETPRQVGHVDEDGIVHLMEPLQRGDI